MVVDVQFYEGQNLDTVSQAETLNAYGREIMADYASYTAAHAMVETAERLTNHESNPQQYLLLVGGLRSLSRADREPGLTLDSYLLRALSLAGWAPNFEVCSNCRKPGVVHAFVVQGGGVVCADCQPPGAAIIDAETAKLLGALLAGDWGDVEASSTKARHAASGIVAAYSQWHIERGLRSLTHVERS